MSYSPKPFEHVSLVVREKPSGILCWVRAKQATVDYMGWGEEFETELRHRTKQSPTGLVQDPGRIGVGLGGKPMMIGLSSDHHRPKPQTRWRFRVANGFTLLDCAELGHFTTADWEWMTNPAGKKWTREKWDDIYRAGR